MTMTAPSVPKLIECPPCSRCHGATRIYGIEPHDGAPRADVLTYVCDACEAIEVRIAPAFHAGVLAGH